MIIWEAKKIIKRFSFLLIIITLNAAINWKIKLQIIVF